MTHTYSYHMNSDAEWPAIAGSNVGQKHEVMFFFFLVFFFATNAAE